MGGKALFVTCGEDTCRYHTMMVGYSKDSLLAPVLIPVLGPSSAEDLPDSLAEGRQWHLSCFYFILYLFSFK